MLPNSTRRVLSPAGLSNSSNSMSKSIIAAWLFGLLFVVCALGLVLQFRQVSKLKLENNNLQEEKRLSQTKREINSDEDLLSHLQEIIDLPADRPTISTVKDLDPTATKNAFLNNAVNGDKMLIFRDRALLFRPSTDKIINMVGVGNLTELPGASSSTPSSITDLSVSGGTSATASESAVAGAVQTLEIRNGTATAGQAKLWQSKMVAKGYKVLAIGNAANDRYAETVLINLSGKDASKLERELGVTAVSNLSGGETSSQADAVLIIGVK